MCAELVKTINSYSTGIAKAKEVIEEKKKCLIGAIRIAKELKITPSVRTYCDLAQVVKFLHCEVIFNEYIQIWIENFCDPSFSLLTLILRFFQ